MKKKILTVLLIGYILLLAYFLLFGRTETGGQYNLIPFKTLTGYFKYKKIYGTQNFIINVYGNIVLLAPISFFVFWIEAKHSLWKGLFVPLVLSGIIETGQFFLKVGSFDVDDILLNTIGGFLVYLILWFGDRLIKRRRRRRTSDRQRER